jgi:hypothetical protein
MTVSGERNERERSVVCTLLTEPRAWKDLPPGFSEMDFECRDYREIYGAIDRHFIGAECEVDKELICRLYPDLAALITDACFPSVNLNGKLQAVAASLKDHHPAPETVIDAEPEPIPIPSLIEYLVRVEMFLRRFVVFPSEHESVAVTLWEAHTHLVERFEVSPILAVTSAEMRSGKTRVLDCLELLVPNPFRSVLPSEAVTYSILAQRPRPTFFLDEADAIFGVRPSDRTEGLRAIFNSGNQAGTPVFRVQFEKGRRKVETFDCFGPKAIAGIGRLPSTVADRSVLIRMRRRSPDEMILKFRRRTAKAEARELAFDWESVTLETVVPVPDELNDRAADSWEPLLAIADLAGGDWPTRARHAAIALSVEEDNPSVGMRLLADTREVFEGEDHLETAILLDRLHGLDASPWAEYFGKPLTARGLARLLEPYRVRPVLRRLGERRVRGYFRADFEDAWKRYTPSVLPVTSVTSVPSMPEDQDVTDVTVGTGYPGEDEEDAERDMRLALEDGN